MKPTSFIRWLAAGGAALLLGAAPALAQGYRIGYVNLERIEKESVAAKQSNEALQREFGARNDELLENHKRIAAARQKLEEERERLDPAEAQARGRELTEMMRQSDQKTARLEQEYEQRRNELAARLVEETRTAIRAVAEAGKYDLIVQEAVFVRPAIDITGQVLKEMASRAKAAR